MECSTCHKKFDEHTAIKEGVKPSPGAISICWGCGQICVFKEDMNLRNINNDELKKIAKETPEAYIQICSAVHLIVERIKVN